MNSLTLHGIEKAYNRGKVGEVVVLRGASLTVAAGEVVAPRAHLGLRGWAGLPALHSVAGGGERTCLTGWQRALVSRAVP